MVGQGRSALREIAFGKGMTVVKGRIRRLIASVSVLLAFLFFPALNTATSALEEIQLQAGAPELFPQSLRFYPQGLQADLRYVSPAENVGTAAGYRLDMKFNA